MRAPPPVEYPSTAGPFWRGALAILVGATAGTLSSWIWTTFALPGLAVVAPGAGLSGSTAGSWRSALVDPSTQVVAAAFLFSLTAALAWRSRRVASAFGFDAGERTLRWDGQDWVLPGDGARPDRRGDAALMLDLGLWMLVRFSPHGLPSGRTSRGIWLPLSCAGDAARWSALRGALWNGRPGAPARR